VTLVLPEEIVPAAPESVPAAPAALCESRSSVTATSAATAAGLPSASCASTVTGKAETASAVAGTEVIASWVAGPASTVNGSLVASVSAPPLAVRTTPGSAFVYVTPEIVTLLVPARIVPVSVPPRVPAPVSRASVTGVSTATSPSLPTPSCASTTTEKPVPAVGLVPPFTDVIASLVEIEMTSNGSLVVSVRPASLDVVSV
jgi:hypothetical protein